VELLLGNFTFMEKYKVVKENFWFLIFLAFDYLINWMLL
jgi:hypothetical protein